MTPETTSTPPPPEAWDATTPEPPRVLSAGARGAGPRAAAAPEKPGCLAAGGAQGTTDAAPRSRPVPLKSGMSWVEDWRSTGGGLGACSFCCGQASSLYCEDSEVFSGVYIHVFAFLFGHVTGYFL